MVIHTIYVYVVCIANRAIVVVVVLLLDGVEAVQCSSSMGIVHVQPLETHTALEGDASQEAVGFLPGLSGLFFFPALAQITQQFGNLAIRLVY